MKVGEKNIRSCPLCSGKADTISFPYKTVFNEVEFSYINFTTTFIFSMGWQIIMVSFGAFTILMYLIKIDSASKTSNLFFLVPPTTAVMAWIVLGEELYRNDLVGLIVAAIGVYIATRK